MIVWDENAQGTTVDGWNWNRFEVNHTIQLTLLDTVLNPLRSKIRP